MKVYTLPVTGVFTTNCYFAIDETTQHGFLIDPGAQGKVLAAIIREKGWTIEKILLTHGHFDHTGGIRELESAAPQPLPVYCHEKGPQYLLDPVLNLSRSCGPDILVEADGLLREGDIVQLRANPRCQLQVFSTPGHTEDSVLFYDAADQTAFVGDTIFKGEAGLTNFPTGDAKKLQQSITRKILTLPDDTLLLSGHSQPTTVGAEKPRYAAPVSLKYL